MNVQLAGQSMEAFMDRRGFRALPEYEQVWAVPVSNMPAAYNLRAHLADLTEQEDEDSISQSMEDRHAARTAADRPFKAKQKVVKAMRVTTTCTESPLNVYMCLNNLPDQELKQCCRLAHPFLFISGQSNLQEIVHQSLTKLASKHEMVCSKRNSLTASTTSCTGHHCINR